MVGCLLSIYLHLLELSAVADSDKKSSHIFLIPTYRPTLALHWPEMALEKLIAYKWFGAHYDNYDSCYDLG